MVHYRGVCPYCSDSDEACGMAKPAQYVEGLLGHGVSTDQSQHVSVSVTSLGIF